MLSIIQAQYMRDYKLELQFSDGKRGVADLQNLVQSFKPFLPLQNKNLFKEFEVDYTVCWSDELDIAPEYLYYMAFKDDETLKPLFEEWGYAA